MSKRIVQHPPETGEGPKYWRSTGQLNETPEFKAWQEREFQKGASELNPEVGRRSFLKYMAASSALAGLSLSGCRREEKLLVPFTQGVEWSVPGKPIFYATSRPHRWGAQPLVATTHDGRPTKLDGNPLHPLSNGASNTHTQAALLDLYDPDRSRRFQYEGQESKEEVFMAWAKDLMAKAGDGAGMAFLSERNPSPTLSRLTKALAAKLPKAMFVAYEPLGREEANEADSASYFMEGQTFRVTPRFDRADVILSLDCNFLGVDEGRTDTTRAFADRRKPEQKMNRLYVVENRYTTTGGMADHRLRARVSQVVDVALDFATAIAKETKNKELADLVAAFPKGEAQKPQSPNHAQWIEEAAKDLVAQSGKALVLVGSRQPAAVQVLVHAMNAVLGALGTTLLGSTTRSASGPSLMDLCKALDERTIKTLFIIGGNPAYNAPAYVKTVKENGKDVVVRTPFGKLMEKAEVVRYGYYEDETSYSLQLDVEGKVEKRNFVKWHVPAAHFLEAWGDGTASDGTYLAQQPMILPLFGGWSEIQLFNFLLTGVKSEGLDLVQESFKLAVGNITPASWAKFLHDGFQSQSNPIEPALPLFNVTKGVELVKKFVRPAAGKKEIVFIPCSKVDDGRYSNNAWMQELPDPITKVTWDNAAIISPKTAREFGLEAEQGNGKFEFANGSWIKITANGEMLEIPVYILPGHADDSISIALGYGRQTEGRVGGRTANYMSHGGLFAKHLPVGFNAYPLRTATDHYFTMADVAVIPDREAYPLAITQEHGALEARGADLIREADLDTHKKYLEKTPKDPKQEWRGFARDKDWLHANHAQDAHAEKMDKDGYPDGRSAYSHPPLNDQNHQWAMSIDLSVCTGCSACMVACQAENNIPVVGKEQVKEGRELHWIRMDRYFVSPMNARHEKRIDIDEPRMVMQPMPCQHCENAPCETVCPVNATVHSEDGLNIMAYNRCIGTRYCANNCPFKVRRFNFFDFNERQKEKYFVPNLWNEKGMAETLQLSKNPNVTVRMRGVMEKCTFCVQRVQEAKIAAKVKAKDTNVVQVPTDSFQVACQQVCASGAIKFGNRMDPKSAVNADIANGRAYRLLDYLVIKARVHYLGRVMNPNPKMPDLALLNEAKFSESLEVKAKGGAK